MLDTQPNTTTTQNNSQEENVVDPTNTQHTTPSNNESKALASPQIHNQTSGMSSSWNKSTTTQGSSSTKSSIFNTTAWQPASGSNMDPPVINTNVSTAQQENKSNLGKVKGNAYSQKNLHSFRVVNVSSNSNPLTGSPTKSPKPGSSPASIHQQKKSSTIQFCMPLAEEAKNTLTLPLDYGNEMKEYLKRFVEELFRECEINGPGFTSEIINILSTASCELSDVSMELNLNCEKSIFCLASTKTN